MIAYNDIKVNAAHPNIPLAPFYAFQASPSNVRIVNVPPRIGKWQITAVSVTLTLPDNSATTVPAVNVAGCWVATLPGSDVTGYCAAGLQVNASGVDENGAAVTGYCLGIGDVTVLGRDAAIAADGKRYYLHLLYAVPEVPQRGDVCVIDGALKWYNGTAWQAFGADVEVVAPSTDPAAAGKAADAKATGDALAGKAKKSDAELIPVYSWTIVPAYISSEGQPTRINLLPGGYVQPEFWDGLAERWSAFGAPKEPNGMEPLTWTIGEESMYEATATPTGIVGYTLGSQAAKPLAALDDRNFAPIYSASAVYAVGELCVHDGVLYRCTSAISAAEAWNAAHWAATDVKSELAGAVDASVAEVTAVTPAVVGWQWPETITFNGVVYYYAPSVNWILENDEREKKFYVVDTYLDPISGESIPYPKYDGEGNMWYAVFGTYEFGEDPEAEIPPTYQWHPAGAFDATDPNSSADATTLTMAFGEDGSQTYTLSYANEPARNKYGLARLVDLPAASTATPQMDGTASAGASAEFARGDHVHPKDTSKQDAIADLAAIRSGAAAGATAYQKPQAGIPASDMAPGVQTSLGKADSAVQPVALPAALRYDLPANATAISSASSEEVEGETVTYGEATLADRTANRVTVTATIAELRLTFPAAVSGKVRDFGLRVEVGDGTAALTAPALVPPAGVTLENADGAIPALADGAADAKGVTLLYFSETAPGVFLVKGEEVKEA